MNSTWTFVHVDQGWHGPAVHSVHARVDPGRRRRCQPRGAVRGCRATDRSHDACARRAHRGARDPGPGRARPDRRPHPDRRRCRRRRSWVPGSSRRLPGSVCRASSSAGWWSTSSSTWRSARSPSSAISSISCSARTHGIWRCSAVTRSIRKPRRAGEQTFFVGLFLLLIGVLWLLFMALGAVWQFLTTTTI